MLIQFTFIIILNYHFIMLFSFFVANILESFETI